jgi:hypothetical protein
MRPDISRRKEHRRENDDYRRCQQHR